LDDPKEAVVNCEKCGSVMQKSEISDIVDHILIGRSHIGRAPKITAQKQLMYTIGAMKCLWLQKGER